MSLKTEYRGYTIHYAENTDTWGCPECGVTGSTLLKAKAKIDAVHLKLRKALFRVFCFHLDVPRNSTRGKITLTAAKVIDYLGRKEERSRLNPKGPTFIGHDVAFVSKPPGAERARRATTMLHTLIADTPETYPALDRLEVAFVALGLAQKAYEEAKAALPRVQFEDIAGLVEASTHKFEEGEP